MSLYQSITQFPSRGIASLPETPRPEDLDFGWPIGLPLRKPQHFQERLKSLWLTAMLANTLFFPPTNPLIATRLAKSHTICLPRQQEFRPPPGRSQSGYSLRSRAGG
jgi:hypothetical protein